MSDRGFAFTYERRGGGRGSVFVTAPTIGAALEICARRWGDILTADVIEMNIREIEPERGTERRGTVAEERRGRRS